MQKTLKPLPVSLSDITTILSNGFQYVDKTKFVYSMVQYPGKFFLSRPRRFGKSTLLSTFNEVFSGKKELFKEQWIYQSPWDWQIYPIIRLDFNVEIDADLKQHIMQCLKLIAINYDVYNEEDFHSSTYGMYFRKLIINLHKKYNQQVVILIDEYDKPILDVIDDVALASKKRDILKGFYTVIKGVDECLRFVFLTGVTRFSKVVVFSDLNNLNDISMDKQYADICGITQEELELYFKHYIEELAKSQNTTYAKCLLKIKEWYNGFCFSEDGISVYNLYSTVLLLQKMKFANYWFTSGNPSFLMKLIKKDANLELYKLDEYQLKVSQFDTFEIDNLNLTAILFQAGYLTIKSYDDISEQYTLAYPNLEISKSFKNNLFDTFSLTPNTNQNLLRDIIMALTNNNLESVIAYLKQIFLNIDYDVKISYEKHYQSIVYLIFQLLGYQINVEYKTNIGRIDAIIQTSTNLYIFEFKLDKTAQIALDQIKAKSYWERFLIHNKPITLIAINFNSKLRNIDDYIIESMHHA